tara:strand:- start:358 stop:651 length:294 start_codon:yes stop_codon:yes gene_type:complete
MKKIILLSFIFLLSLNNLYADWLANINKHPYFSKASIESGTLIIIPDLENVSIENLDKLAKTFCFYGPEQGFKKVNIIDSMEYIKTGKLKSHTKISC